ncbi:uncharacterized protein [Rutidosis leptorrhynchoides]|uniref:uncharacterized protein n=1 Tax=Rutidosis leptorrhynchoides TaxID=125765 RepID=UPI003A993D39
MSQLHTSKRNVCTKWNSANDSDKENTPTQQSIFSLRKSKVSYEPRRRGRPPNYTKRTIIPVSFNLENVEHSNAGSTNISQNTSVNAQPTQGRRRSKYNNINLEPLSIQSNSTQTNLSNYKDNGDPTFVCNVWNAKLWRSEALRGNRGLKKQVYSLCCYNSKVEIPLLEQPPPLLLNLYKGNCEKSQNFIENIRRYNMMFSFTSIGGKVDHKINSGRGPYVYRMCGQNYHLAGSVLPDEGDEPTFCSHFISSTSKNVSTPFSLEFQMIRIRLIGRRDKDGRTYNLPTTDEVAAIIVGDIDGRADKRDIILETKLKQLQRISEYHPSYLALQYPLLFPYAKDGYMLDTYHRGIESQDVSGHSQNARLSYLRKNQKILRVTDLNNLYDADEASQDGVSEMRCRIILSSSFTGGARYMHQNYLDAMAIVRAYGYPDLFITFTCNPKWLEIVRFVESEDLKRKTDHKLPNPSDIDRVITAEIPNKDGDPELYELVSDFMIHGPCGPDHPGCPCMQIGKCSKHFPKDFALEKRVDGDAYPIYRRRDDGNYIMKGDKKLDCRNVVPYNKTLLKQYRAHINVEWCNQLGAIKYLFKYINKGPDRITMAVERSCDSNIACEASWRLFNYEILYRTPIVYRLQFHRPNHQPIYFDGDEDIEDVLTKPSVGTSMFLEWMECNKHDANSRPLTYVEFPRYYVWKDDIRKWTKRIGQRTVGRINFVPPKSDRVWTATKDLLSDDLKHECPPHLKLNDTNQLREVLYNLSLVKIEKMLNSSDSELAALLNKAKLIIWDEAPLMHIHCFEAFDCKMRDIIRSPNKDPPFGGKVVVFGGDFHQILPVIQKGTRAEIVDASIHSSHLWKHCKVLRLTKNMRLISGSDDNHRKELSEFADWILKIGEGKINEPNDGEADVTFPRDVLLTPDSNHVEAKLNKVCHSY